MKSAIIKNAKELATNELRKDALDILEAGYQAVLTNKILKEKIKLSSRASQLVIGGKKYDLEKYKNIFVIAFGKCANESAKVLEEVLGDKITDGIVLDIKSTKFKKLKSKTGTHPLPSEKNILATESIIELLEKAQEKDLIITLISGGGSALLCAPALGVENDSLIKVTKELMKKGANISEMNIVRKHLSQIKGGQLAKLAYPAKLVSIIFSDVPGNDLSMIASGPTVMDKTTKEDAQMVLESYFIDEPAVDMNNPLAYLTETPKDKKYFEKVDNILLVTNEVALGAMSDKAKELDYKVIIESDNLQGEARDLGKELISEGYESKSCHIWGGETTVQIKGEGEGGRNQEFVLSALKNISDDMLVLACASDGWDNTDVAGALADKEVLNLIEKKKIDIDDYLENNNSYNFFKQTATQLNTGKTGINVADFYLILKA